MAAVDRICETCHTVSHTEAEICPDDGGRLAPITRDEDMVGRVIDDKLTLTGVIGRGGMGVVYRALQHSMDREVAVKLLHPSYSDDAGAVKRFLHEAKAASRLDHPNVITVFDSGRTEDGLLYLVMELLNGAELAQVIDVSPLGLERSVHILTQVCDAVHHAHERGLVHRDLKPENVFLLTGSALRRDFVKVLDFGIARMRAYEGIERLTQTGSICGTPGYMSPEQVLGDEVDRRSDVYALGVLAFEMITGVHPFPADTAMRQLLAHLETPPPTFAAVGADPDLPPAVELVVMKALQKEADARFATAMELGDALVAAAAGRAPEALAPSEPVLAVVEDAAARASQPTTRGRVAKATTPRRAGSTASGRGFADTMIATEQVALAPKPRGRRVLYALVAAAAVAVVVFLLTRGERPEGASQAAELQAEVSHPTPPEGETPTPEPAGPTPGEPSTAAVVAPDAGATETPDTSSIEAKAEDVVEADAAPEAVADTASAAASVADTVAPEPAAPAPILVTSEPAGARVVAAGNAIGVTPVEVPRPPAGMKWKVVVSKPNYRPVTRYLTDADDALAVTLSPRRRTSGGTTAKDAPKTDPGATGPAPPPIVP